MTFWRWVGHHATEVIMVVVVFAIGVVVWVAAFHDEVPVQSRSAAKPSGRLVLVEAPVGLHGTRAWIIRDERYGGEFIVVTAGVGGTQSVAIARLGGP